MSRFSIRGIILVAAFIFTACLNAVPAAAEVVARVDIATQRMTVTVDGNVTAVWAVSTARHGYHTPVGVYRPKSLQRMHYSSKYENSPMPFSVFFRGGYAVHGTHEVHHLGRPASHGCVRLSTANAAVLYHLIQQHGTGDTRIIIS